MSNEFYDKIAAKKTEDASDLELMQFLLHRTGAEDSAWQALYLVKQFTSMASMMAPRDPGQLVIDTANDYHEKEYVLMDIEKQEELLEKAKKQFAQAE